MLKQLEKADDLISEAYDNRKKQYLDAYQNLEFGEALQKN